MKIFDKRPLALILCIGLCSFVIFSLCGLGIKIFLFSLLSLLLALTFFKDIKEKINPIFTRLLLLTSLVFMLLSSVYFSYFKAYERFSDKVTVIGVITEYDDTEYGKSATIKSSSIDNKLFSSYKLSAVIPNDLSVNLSNGARVLIECKISDFESSASFDTKSYYLSKGYSGRITDIESVEYVGVEDSFISEQLYNIRLGIKNTLIDRLGEENGGLVTALLIGDASHMSGQVSLDFMRIGISHILALSGMHLAIIVLGFSRLLGFFGLNRKFRSIFIIIFTIFYMGLTGFPVSVTRAGIMLIICHLLFLLSHKADSLTSLFIAVFVIFLIEPYSVLSLSLWLSAAATLGIVAYTNEFSDKTERARKKNAVFTSISVSLFAVYSTVLISNLYFDGISFLSAVTTLIFSPLIEVYLYLGIFTLIFNFPILASVSSAVGNFIIRLSSEISAFDYVYISNSSQIVLILTVIFSIALVLFFVLKIKNKKLGAAILSSLYVMIIVSAYATSLSVINTPRFDYVSMESGEEIIILENGSVNIISVDYKTQKKRDETATFFRANYITEIDKYVVTSYKNGTDSYLYFLLSDYKLEKLYLPMPRNDSEHEICVDILDFADNFRAEIIFYDFESPIEIESYKYLLIKNHAYNSSEKGEMLFTVYHNESFYTYLNTNIFLTKYKNIAKDVIAGSDTVIIGYNKENDFKFTYKMPYLKKLIISDKYIKIPRETVDFYNEKKICFYPELTEIK